MVVSNGILRESDIICVVSLTIIFLGDIERDLISPHEITVLFSTFKDLNVVSSAFKQWWEILLVSVHSMACKMINFLWYAISGISSYINDFSLAVY